MVNISAVNVMQNLWAIAKATLITAFALGALWTALKMTTQSHSDKIAELDAKVHAQELEFTRFRDALHTFERRITDEIHKTNSETQRAIGRLEGKIVN